MYFHVMNLADISIINACNFSCSYCKSESMHVRQNNSNGVWDVMGPVTDFAPLINFIKTHIPDYRLQITGGEPLLVPGVEYLLNDLANIGNVILNTNGSLLPRKYPLLSSDIFYRISIHPDQRTLDKFREHVDYIPKGRFIVNYVLHPEHIRNGKAIEYIEFLDECGYNYEVTPFEGKYEGKDYKLFSELYRNVQSPVPKSDEDIQIVIIKPNGKVFACGEAANSVVIGDIYSNEFNVSAIKSKRCTFVDGTSLCSRFSNVHRIRDIENGTYSQIG